MPDELYRIVNKGDGGFYEKQPFDMADVRRLAKAFHKHGPVGDLKELAPFAALLKEKNDAQG